MIFAFAFFDVQKGNCNILSGVTGLTRVSLSRIQTVIRRKKVFSWFVFFMRRFVILIAVGLIFMLE